MSQTLRSALLAQSDQAASNRTHVKKGMVTGTDPVNHAVKVTLQPGGQETGFIPVKSMWVGEGWGMFCLPSVGTQVEVAFEGGRVEAGAVTGQLYDQVNTSIPGALEGEFWLRHKSGTLIKLTNDTKLTIIAVGDLDITGQADANVTITGNVTLTVQGDVTANVTGTVLLKSDDVELGDSGGPAVARVGDSVDLSTGLIITGSDKVTAA